MIFYKYDAKIFKAKIQIDDKNFNLQKAKELLEQAREKNELDKESFDNNRNLTEINKVNNEQKTKKRAASSSPGQRINEIKKNKTQKKEEHALENTKQ